MGIHIGTYIYEWPYKNKYVEIPWTSCVTAARLRLRSGSQSVALWYAQVWLIPFNPCEGSKVTQPLPQMLFSRFTSNSTRLNIGNPTYCGGCVAACSTRSAGGSQVCHSWLNFQTANSCHFFLTWWSFKLLQYQAGWINVSRKISVAPDCNIIGPFD